ncbi:hypothetical protein [Paraburkholderia flava]|uniref:hypothetical protein n=1 Tax=Paraburkholderia flava TaxID=2547393 RepID=UPI00105CE1A5|nr:hypothetical protein [Paraburkholderia flava]
MTGWILGIALLIAEIELAFRGLIPFIPRISGWGWDVFGIAWLLSGLQFCALWGWLMSRCGVPKEDIFTRDS